MNKAELRQYIRERKKAMSDAEIRFASNQLADLLYQTEYYKNANTIYGYMSYNQEVRTEQILQKALSDGKQIAVPKVYGDTMRFIYLDDLMNVEKGYAGIPEPTADAPVATDPHALVLMPGLAFDRNGNRIGYGGGFYDQFLAREPGHPTIALCYEFQIMDHLDTEAFDIPVDCVLWV